jgi:hypothetical protein
MHCCLLKCSTAQQYRITELRLLSIRVNLAAMRQKSHRPVDRVVILTLLKIPDVLPAAPLCISCNCLDQVSDFLECLTNADREQAWSW